MSIANDAQKFDVGEIIDLFDWDLTSLGGNIEYFTTSVYTDSPVTWKGNLYTPVDITADGFEVTGEGTLPRPKFQISNAYLATSAAIIQYGNDILGTIITRTRTLKKYLDGQPTADPTQFWPLDVYELEQKVRQDKFYVEWACKSLMDCEGRMIPGRQIIRDICWHSYRRWVSGAWDYTSATCKYEGTGYWDATGTPCIESLDRCGLRPKDCRLRFTGKTALPFGGFPGVARVRVQ